MRDSTVHTTTLYTHINLFIVPLLMRRSDVSVDVSLVKDIEIMITFNVSNFYKYLNHRYNMKPLQSVPRQHAPRQHVCGIGV